MTVNMENAGHWYSDEQVEVAELVIHLREQVEMLKSMVVVCFDHGNSLRFYQGWQDHEMAEVVTADYCQYLVDRIYAIQNKDAAHDSV